jgi:hypothetical protein
MSGILVDVGWPGRLRTAEGVPTLVTMRAVGAVGCAVVAAAALTLVEGVARADDLSAAEVGRLEGGRCVTRTQDLTRGDRRYVGGVTYAIVDGHANDVAALFEDLGAWTRIFPMTRETRAVGADAGDALVEVTHGSAFVHVTYTMRVRRAGNVVRFWLEPSRPHDIEDVWGFLRTEPLAGPRQLVTFGILIDMGAGLMRDLFEDRVREIALTVPDRVRGLLLERRAAAFDESLVRRTGVRY